MSDSESPIELAPSDDLSRLGWFAVFVAGFCGMFLVFFHFYAGVFALELYSERDLDMSIFTRRTLDGTVSVAFGALTCGCLAVGLFGAPLGLTKKRQVWVVMAVVLGVSGVATTLAGTYAPLIQPPLSEPTTTGVNETRFINNKNDLTKHEESQMAENYFSEVVVSADGIPEIDDAVLAHHQGSVRVIDVREVEEYHGELGHIAGSELVPLGQLEEEAAGWSKDDAVVTVCRSGGRSGRAALALNEAGFSKVVSLKGGMTAWNKAGRPTER